MPQSSGSPASDPQSPGNGGASSAATRRLTANEKKQNHIASEQKRRAAIRKGFEELSELVPGMQGQARSENLVLQSTNAYLKEMINQHRDLINEARAKGVDVSDQMIEGFDYDAPAETDLSLGVFPSSTSNADASGGINTAAHGNVTDQFGFPFGDSSASGL
jgi:heteromeric Ino2p/Ino4p transcription factor